MRIQRLSLVPAVLALLAVAGPMQAQADPFSGTFVRDVAAGDDMDRVINEQAMPKVKSTLGKIFKGKARARLHEVNRPYGWIRFAPQGDRITVETDHWNGAQGGLTTERSGTLKDWARRAPNGKVEKIDVITRTQGRTFTQRFEAEDGARTNVYTLSPDGKTLTMNVTIESGQLTGPVAYKLVYRRRG